MNKLDKLIQTLETMANAHTPNDGNTAYTNDGDGSYTAIDFAALAVDTAYRVGRALTLARAIKREQD